MNIEDFTRGWIVGDFAPALVQTKDVEIGILDLPYGHKGDGHIHKLHVEHNLILSGTAKVKGELFFDGDIFTYYPGEKSDVEFFEDTRLLVIKTPATKEDKHYEPTN